MESQAKTVEEEIVRLTDIWYTYVSMDHHKDRDCHWYISTEFSYGKEPTYRVHHDGYIGDRMYCKCPTYEKALEQLLWQLQTSIRQAQYYAKRNRENPEEWGDTSEQDTFILGVEL